MFSIATRFFGKDPAKDLPRLDKYIESGLKLGRVHVAVNIDEDKCDTVSYCKERHPAADVFAVTPWQKFVAPLNALVYRAHRAGSTRLLIASAEFAPSSESVTTLLEHLDSTTLVAGARFSEHEWSEGFVKGTGSTVPWNTYALWNLNFLARFGFPLIGDASFDQSKAGVEEVSAIALYQYVFGHKAKLVQVPGFYEEWDMSGWDDDRKKKHAEKIKSKVGRPQSQLEWAGMANPRVIHTL